jgi:hydrogenase nickel incorporation protein HypA/HybF
MHEMGLSQAILDATLRRAAGRQVHAVRVRVGGHPVEPEVVAHGFQVAAVGTPAEHAAVELVMEPLTAHCLTCGHTTQVHDTLDAAVCRACGGLDVELAGTEDVILESITVDEPAVDNQSQERSQPTV